MTPVNSAGNEESDNEILGVDSSDSGGQSMKVLATMGLELLGFARGTTLSTGSRAGALLLTRPVLEFLLLPRDSGSVLGPELRPRGRREKLSRREREGSPRRDIKSSQSKKESIELLEYNKWWSK